MGNVLLTACRYNNIYMVQKVLEWGADIDYHGKNGKTAIDYAKDYANSRIGYSDYTLYRYLTRYLDNGCSVEDTEKFYSEEDWFHNPVYKPEIINTTEDTNDDILESMESKKRAEFILSEYEAEDLLSKNTTAQELSDFLDEYNWDDGLEVPYFVSKHKKCDLGIAMKLFYLADGLGILAEDFEEKAASKWGIFVKVLYEHIKEGTFRKKDISYKIPLSTLQKKNLEGKLPEIFLQDVIAE
ncbi:MAG: DUF4274 domain-containing protein [Lachnospiraceae bacterium]|nr:DUF4274 domain-containing protein [Lachnospiraceae bacterium]